MRRGRSILLFRVVPALAAVAAAAFLFSRAGYWLVVSDSLPARVDVVMTFAGNMDRFEFGRDLAKRLPDALWFCSIERMPVFDTVTVAGMARRHLLLHGIDTARVTMVDTCTSTRGELAALEAWLRPRCRGQGPKAGRVLSVVCVSSPYHTRRILIEARRRMKQLPVRFYSVPVTPPYQRRERFEPGAWWTREEDADVVISELIKLVYYRLR